MINPMQHAIYKGTGGKFGAIQFNFQPPHFYKGKVKDYKGVVDSKNDKAAFEVTEDDKVRLKEGWKERQGAVFVEIASTVPGQKNVYDWSSKITMALSINDLGKVLLFLATGKETSIMHDPHANSNKARQVQKFLKMSSPKGTAQGCLISMTEAKKGEDSVSHTVPVTGDELLTLRMLITQAIPATLNW